MIIRPIPYGDPLAFAAELRGKPPFALLNGAVGRKDGSRYSYVAADPFRRITADGAHVWVDDKIAGAADGALDVLEKELRACAFIPDAGALPVPFCGGAVGALSYEMGGALETLPQPKTDALGLPRLRFCFYDSFAAFDHDTRQAWVIGRDAAKVDALVNLAARAPQSLPPLDWSQGGAWMAEQTRGEVEQNIRAVIDYIYAGDVFQANYTQKFRALRPAGLDDFTLYRRLCALSPAPFSALLAWDDVTLASVSPERFLRLKNGKVQAWPIKGTRPRDLDPARDAAFADELSRSAKDRAENLMIVDLMRSDLSRVCAPGTVKVPRLNALESFASVHHLVSHVEGRLRPGLGPVDVLRATFPGGSVTGAPKIRAMQIIHELEPSPRGFYCGSFGWIGFDGTMDMAMTIRTLTLTRDVILAQAGGGIVADSDPAAEYDESMVKLAPLLRAVTGDA